MYCIILFYRTSFFIYQKFIYIHKTDAVLVVYITFIVMILGELLKRVCKHQDFTLMC